MANPFRKGLSDIVRYRKIKTFGRIVVYRDYEWDGYWVAPKNEEVDGPSSYFTDDKEDAFLTAKHMNKGM